MRRKNHDGKIQSGLRDRVYEVFALLKTQTHNAYVLTCANFELYEIRAW